MRPVTEVKAALKPPAAPPTAAPVAAHTESNCSRDCVARASPSCSGRGHQIFDDGSGDPLANIGDAVARVGADMEYVDMGFEALGESEGAGEVR